jgi:hypothetical protein
MRVTFQIPGSDEHQVFENVERITREGFTFVVQRRNHMIRTRLHASQLVSVEA